MMKDDRVDFYLQKRPAPPAPPKATASDWLTFHGTVGAALAEAEKSRGSYARKSKAKAAVDLDGIIAGLRELRRRETDAEYAVKAKAHDKRKQRSRLVARLLTAIGQDDGADATLKALAVAVLPAFDTNGSISFAEVLRAARAFGGDSIGDVLDVAIEAADDEAKRQAAKGEWNYMNRHAADAARLVACKNGLDYK